MGSKKHKRERHLSRLKKKRQSAILWEERMELAEPFFLKYRIEMILLILIPVAAFLIFYFGDRNRRDPVLAQLNGSISEEQRTDWSTRYPDGFRALVVTGGRVMALSGGTLPKDLHIDWDQVIPVKRPSEGEFAVRFPVLQWKASGMLYDFTFVLDRKIGAASVMNLAPGVQLVMELISDDQGRTLCLLGLKFL